VNDRRAVLICIIMVCSILVEGGLRLVYWYGILSFILSWAFLLEGILMWVRTASFPATPGILSVPNLL